MTTDLESGGVVAGRYRVVREIAKGGMARVYEVFDETRGAAAAMKRLEADDTRWNEAALLLQREYDTLPQLQHPRCQPRRVASR